MVSWFHTHPTLKTLSKPRTVVLLDKDCCTTQYGMKWAACTSPGLPTDQYMEQPILRGMQLGRVYQLVCLMHRLKHSKFKCYLSIRVYNDWILTASVTSPIKPNSNGQLTIGPYFGPLDPPPSPLSLAHSLSFSHTQLFNLPNQ